MKPYNAGWKDGLEAAITIVEARRDASMGDDLRKAIDMAVGVAVSSIRELMGVHDADSEAEPTVEHKRIYIGPPEQPYAQDQINVAGRDGWQLVQIIGNDAWVKRKKAQ